MDSSGVSAGVLRGSAPGIVPQRRSTSGLTVAGRARSTAATGSRGIAARAQVAVARTLISVGQVSLLWFFGWAGHELVAFFHLPLPGNVAGLVLMFVALLSGVVPLRFVEQGAALLLACLPLFFVPLAVGLGSTAQLTASSGLAILLILSGSAAVGFAVTGGVAQRIARSQTKSLAATRSSNVHVDADRC